MYHILHDSYMECYLIRCLVYPGCKFTQGSHFTMVYVSMHLTCFNEELHSFFVFFIQSTNPRPDKVRKLLDDLSRRGPDVYDKFLDCLDQSGHSHISDYIREKERQLRNPNSNPVLQGSRFSVQQRTSGSHGNQVICQPTHPPESSCELTHSASDVPLSSYLQSSSVVTSQSSPSLSFSGLPVSTPSEENSSQSENPDVQMRTPVENQNQNSTALGYLHETLADNTSSQFVQGINYCKCINFHGFCLEYIFACINFQF